MTLTPLHIVVADDDDDDQEIIKKSIQELNSGRQIHITSVFDGVQLMECLQKRGFYSDDDSVKPHLILLDVNMPMLDGLKVLKQIKDNDHLRDIPVFVISTLRTMERVETFLEMGAANFFSKPNNMEGYKTIVEEIFAKWVNTPEVKVSE